MLQACRLIPAGLRARRRPAGRGGSAAVELAICLPLLATFVFGSIEICRMIFLNQTLHAAAYEGARAAIRSNSTSAAVERRVGEVLEARQVSGARLTVEPPDAADVERGEPIVVTVTAPFEARGLMPGWFYAGRTLSAECVMIKE